jgi:hypothetical protein
MFIATPTTISFAAVGSAVAATAASVGLTASGVGVAWLQPVSEAINNTAKTKSEMLFSSFSPLLSSVLELNRCSIYYLKSGIPFSTERIHRADSFEFGFSHQFIDYKFKNNVMRTVSIDKSFYPGNI